MNGRIKELHLSAIGLGLLFLVWGCHNPHRDRSARAPVAARAGAGQTHSASTVAATTPERFRRHIEILAHDSFEGRDTGARGGDLAAGYIAGQFASAGLLPGGADGSYFQPFTAAGRLEIQPETFLDVEPTQETLKPQVDFVPLGGSPNAAFAGDVVFAGYGIVNEEYHHDDYAGIDVRGKVVLAFRGEPEHLNIDGEASEYARFSKKADQAAQQGATALLLVYTKPDEGGADRLPRLRRSRDAAKIPVMYISRALTNQWLAVGGFANLDELEAALATPGATRSAPLTGVSVRGQVATAPKKLPTQNVVGILPGQGSLASEYVVIGAHYDHLGTRRNRVYNGADDNASGVSGVIELATSLSRERVRNRSLIFIAFSGEEIDLLGSKHYTAHPPVSLSQIKAMLNMDMIGRLARTDAANPLQVFGLGTGANFREIVQRRAAEMGMAIETEASSLVPTDSAPFYQAGVPALWFFTGLHSDYHAPGDDAEKIDAIGGARIVQFVHQVACDIVNDSTSPQYAKVETSVNVHGRASRTTLRASLGAMPDFDDESLEAGMALGEVRKNGPAGKAGVRSGDRVTAIDDYPVDDFTDISAALTNKNPGDTVQVSARRNGETLTFSVELAARPAP